MFHKILNEHSPIQNIECSALDFVCYNSFLEKEFKFGLSGTELVHPKFHQMLSSLMDIPLMKYQFDNDINFIYSLDDLTEVVTY